MQGHHIAFCIFVNVVAQNFGELGYCFARSNQMEPPVRKKGESDLFEWVKFDLEGKLSWRQCSAESVRVNGGRFTIGGVRFEKDWMWRQWFSIWKQKHEKDCTRNKLYRFVRVLPRSLLPSNKYRSDVWWWVTCIFQKMHVQLKNRTL